MRTLDDLRRTLQQEAGNAPDGSGVLEGARSGAARIRQRRRRVGGAVAACAVVALAVGTPVAGRLLIHRPAPGVAAVAYRQPYELTLSLAPNPYYETMVQGTEGHRQYLIARPPTAAGDPGGTVVVHDPATFDPAVLRRGERVTVGGHDAWYVTSVAGAQPTGGPPQNREYLDASPGVGWPDPSGAWVVVSEGGSRNQLLRLAATVRLGAPVTARAPFRLGWTPPGLPVSYASSRQVARNGVNAAVGLGAAPDGAGAVFMMADQPPEGTPITISALPLDGIESAWGSDYAGRPSRTVAGHRVWYSETDDPFTPGDGSSLRVLAGNCGITVDVHDRVRFPYETLARMVEGMTFRGGCTTADDWPPIVG